jgi:hypothetical protein
MKIVRCQHNCKQPDKRLTTWRNITRIGEHQSRQGFFVGNSEVDICLLLEVEDREGFLKCRA